MPLQSGSGVRCSGAPADGLSVLTLHAQFSVRLLPVLFHICLMLIDEPFAFRRHEHLAAPERLIGADVEYRDDDAVVPGPSVVIDSGEPVREAVEDPRDVLLPGLVFLKGLQHRVRPEGNRLPVLFREEHDRLVGKVPVRGEHQARAVVRAEARASGAGAAPGERSIRVGHHEVREEFLVTGEIPESVELIRRGGSGPGEEDDGCRGGSGTYSEFSVWHGV